MFSEHFLFLEILQKYLPIVYKYAFSRFRFCIKISGVYFVVGNGRGWKQSGRVTSSLSIICHFCKTNHIQAGRKFILITAALPVSIIMCVCITYYLPLQEFNVRHKRGMIRKIIVTMATKQCRCTVEPTFEGCENVLLYFTVNFWNAICYDNL